MIQIPENNPLETAFARSLADRLKTVQGIRHVDTFGEKDVFKNDKSNNPIIMRVKVVKTHETSTPQRTLEAQFHIFYENISSTNGYVPLPQFRWNVEINYKGTYHGRITQSSFENAVAEETAKNFEKSLKEYIQKNQRGISNNVLFSPRSYEETRSFTKEILRIFIISSLVI